MASKKSKASLSSVDPSKKLLSDSSSLVDLKAEVFRKHQEAKFNRLHGKTAPTFAPDDADKDKAERIWSRKNAGLTAREKRDLARSEEERRDDARVREALGRKAELYDKLKEGAVAGGERFLVRFGRDHDDDDSDEGPAGDYPARDEGEEWVEYTDALGRTRTCMRRDLERLRRQDRELSVVAEERRGDAGQPIPERDGADAADLLSEDMRRELLRLKWEKEEEENLRKRDVHYQDVLFDEARTHGAGFYRFSKDEGARQEEKEELDQLHKETQRARTAAEAEKAKRKSALKARLKRVRDKKRLRMGLPVVDSDSDQDDKEDGALTTEDAPEKSLEEDIMGNLKKLRQEREEREREARRRATVREWDVGKDGVSGPATPAPSSSSSSLMDSYGMKGEKRLMDQKEWVAERRRDRQNDFAPPTNYEPSRGGRKRESAPATTRSLDSQYGRPKVSRSASASASASSQSSWSSSSSGFSAPPPSQFSRPPPGFPPPPMEPQPKQDIPAKPADPMAALNEGASAPVDQDDSDDDDDEVQPPGEDEGEAGSSVTIGERLRMFREASHFGAPADSSSAQVRGQGAEVAPPCSMDYYNSTASASKPRRKRSDMSESFKFGVAAKAKPKVIGGPRHFAFEEEGGDSDDD